VLRTPVPLAARHRPSPIFLAVVLIALLGAAMCTQVIATADPGIWVFVVVLAGWIVSLCLHEFSHAWVAFRAGDQQVAARGYLTLDPRRYTHPLVSIALPVLFLALGGFGLPGGAVYVDRAAIRSRWANSLVSLAGPATNLALGFVLLLPYRLGLEPYARVPFIDEPIVGQPSALTGALALLGFLQFTAAFLNLLPIPGLDGFGVLEPFLPAKVLRLLAPLRPFAIVLLFLVVARTHFVFALARDVTEAMGIPPGAPRDGFDWFRFWR
jgi:Zn-dependent protease